MSLSGVLEKIKAQGCGETELRELFDSMSSLGVESDSDIGALTTSLQAQAKEISIDESLAGQFVLAVANAAFLSRTLGEITLRHVEGEQPLRQSSTHKIVALHAENEALMSLVSELAQSIASGDVSETVVVKLSAALKCSHSLLQSVAGVLGSLEVDEPVIVPGEELSARFVAITKVFSLNRSVLESSDLGRGATERIVAMLGVE